jgi:hypothetical protein
MIITTYSIVGNTVQQYTTERRPSAECPPPNIHKLYRNEKIIHVTIIYKCITQYTLLNRVHMPTLIGEQY